jgi:CRP-like cAMP-binding protein
MISRAVEVGCLAIRPRRMATATAMAECEIMRLEKAAVIALILPDARRLLARAVFRAAVRRGGNSD